MVLWVLIMVGYLTEQHLIHNREKAGLAVNSWTSFRQKHAVESILHFFAADSWPIPDQPETNGMWHRLHLKDWDLWVRVVSEEKKVNINTETESGVRETVSTILGEDRRNEADSLTDAILDWRDTDTLVRLNGAEKDYYAGLAFPYLPADGPFKTITELLLVRGMTAEIFWGDPLESIVQESLIESDGKPENEQSPFSFIDGFTIYSKDVKCIHMVMPGGRKTYLVVAAFLKKGRTGWQVLAFHQTVLASKYHFKDIHVRQGNSRVIS